MSSWTDQFGAGAILESTDGATYNEIKELHDPKAENYKLHLLIPLQLNLMLREERDAKKT